MILFNKFRIHFDSNETIKSAFMSSFISSILIYPFDLISTRMATDMSRYGHKRIYYSVYESLKRVLDEQSIKNFNFRLI